MSPDLRAELTDMVGPADWTLLSPHADRDAVVIVNPELDLVEVGVAIATDNVPQVDRWITEELLTKPSYDQRVVFEAQAKQFNALIVQPFVLIQDVAAP